VSDIGLVLSYSSKTGAVLLLSVELMKVHHGRKNEERAQVPLVYFAQRVSIAQTGIIPEFHVLTSPSTSFLTLTTAEDLKGHAS
jgi:hypothetical protein